MAGSLARCELGLDLGLDLRPWNLKLLPEQSLILNQGLDYAWFWISSGPRYKTWSRIGAQVWSIPQGVLGLRLDLGLGLNLQIFIYKRKFLLQLQRPCS